MRRFFRRLLALVVATLVSLVAPAQTQLSESAAKKLSASTQVFLEERDGRANLTTYVRKDEDLRREKFTPPHG